MAVVAMVMVMVMVIVTMTVTVTVMMVVVVMMMVIVMVMKLLLLLLMMMMLSGCSSWKRTPIGGDAHSRSASSFLKDKLRDAQAGGSGASVSQTASRATVGKGDGALHGFVPAP